MAYMNQNQIPDDEEAKFNFGLALLKRIDMEFTALEENLAYGNLQQSKNIVDCLFDELDAFLDDAERDKLNTISKDIDAKIDAMSNIDETITSKQNGMVITKYVFPNQRKEVKPMIINMNREIRRIMKSKGLLMPAKDESALF